MGAGKTVTSCYWKASNYATRAGNYNYVERNSSGFSAFPAGTFNETYNYYPGLGDNAFFWTITQDTSNNKNAVRYYIKYDWEGVKRDVNKKLLGGSIRCVRDAE